MPNVYKLKEITDMLFAANQPDITYPQYQLNHIDAASMPHSSPDLQKVCGDGERTAHLTKLAGKWIAEGREFNEVIMLAQGWNANNTPPLDTAKVSSTCASILKTHQRNHPNQPIGFVSTNIQPLFPLNVALVGKYLTTDPPPRRWLLNNMLPFGKVGLIVAPGGTGKSQFMLQLCVSIATGVQLCNCWDVGESGGVLAIFAEDDDEEIHRRLRNISDMLLCSILGHHTSITNNLYIKSMVGQNNQMTSSLPSGGVKGTDYADRLIMTAQGIKDLKLIVIDPASRFRGGVENSAEDTTRFVEQLEYISKKLGVTVLVIHHANKGSMNANETSQSAARGSSALTDGVRWQMNLQTMSSNEAKKIGIDDKARRNYVMAEITKNNYAAPQSPVCLMRDNFGTLTSTAGQLQTKTKSVMANIITAIKSEAANNKFHSATGFENTFGGETGPLKTGKVAVRNALKEALDSGQIIKNSKNKLEIPTH